MDALYSTSLSRRCNKSQTHFRNGKKSSTQQEKEHKEAIEDLCISLSTIDRAEGSFEKFYLDSLIEDLERIAKLLEEE